MIVRLDGNDCVWASVADQISTKDTCIIERISV